MTSSTRPVPWAEASGFQSKTADGRLIGPFNVMLFSPEMGAAFLKLQEVEQKHTSLSSRLRQIVILSTGAIWKAPYELYAHSAVARKAGLSEAAVRALAHGEPSDELTGDERLAQRFTRRLFCERRVDDALYQAAAAAFGAKGMLDMIMLAGCYEIVCSALNAFDIPAPEPFPADDKRDEASRKASEPSPSARLTTVAELPPGFS